MDSFGEQLKKARNKVGMSQDVLARRALVAKNTIVGIEGGNTPHLDTALKFVWALKASFEFEYGGHRIVLMREAAK